MPELFDITTDLEESECSANKSRAVLSEIFDYFVHNDKSSHENIIDKAEHLTWLLVISGEYMDKAVSGINKAVKDLLAQSNS